MDSMDFHAEYIVLLRTGTDSYSPGFDGFIKNKVKDRFKIGFSHFDKIGVKIAAKIHNCKTLRTIIGK